MLIPYTAPAELYRQDMEIKKSIFITHILPVNSEEEAQQALADFRKKYKDATHNCYAWRIGTERILEKSGDDGEPQGTAGHPMLHVLQMRKLTNVLAVVTRYFGGIKLGAGGLVRAYGGAAAECLRLGLRQPLLAMVELELACAFDDLGTVHAALQAHAAEKTGERYLADGAVLSLRLPTSQAAALQLRLRDATRDRIRFAAPATTEMH